jgi:hypothetical protein
MATIRLVLFIQQSIVADFFLGASSSTLTSKYKITMREIYAILQNLFRSVTISRTQQSPVAGAHGIGVNDLTSVDLTRALHDLREEIRAKRQTNLQFPEDHSRGGTERRRTHLHDSRKQNKIFAKVTTSSAKQSIPLSR